MAEYIEREEVLKHYRALANIDWNNKVSPPSWSYAYESFIDYLEELPTADVVPKSEVHDDHHKQVACYTLGCREGDKIKREIARVILSDLKKQIHDKAVYTNSQDIPNYVNLKVFDAVLQTFLNKYSEDVK